MRADKLDDPERVARHQCRSRAAKQLGWLNVSNSREHRTWLGMRSRCNNPKASSYGRYGGRGIRVCDRWNESFIAFYEDMGPHPGPGYSIDRIDNDGNYEPGNCRWATRAQQARNKRDTRRLTVGGVTKPIREWAEITGLSRDLIFQRMERGTAPDLCIAPIRYLRIFMPLAPYSFIDGSSFWQAHSFPN